MKLFEALPVDLEQPAVVSFCGGGGKTSSMLTLARELKALGKSVLVATTTKIFIPTLDEYDQLVITDDVSKIESLQERKGKITVIAPGVVYPKLKLDSISFDILDRIRSRQLFQFILIEADGAQCRPIKAPANHEPVIYPDTNIMVGVTGFDSYHKELTEKWVHRPERLIKITDQQMGDVISENTYLKLTQSPLGLFKGAPKQAKKAGLLIRWTIPLSSIKLYR